MAQQDVHSGLCILMVNHFDMLFFHIYFQRLASYSVLINPKRCGLFGLLDMRVGGRILPGLRKHSITPSNAFLEQQTESLMKAEVFS